MSDFVKIVFIQLADKTGKVAVLKMFGQNGFGKSFVLHWTSDYRAIGGACPFPLVPTSSTTKLSPSSPHLTTDE